MNILISACLLGVNCRYDGGGKLIHQIEKLKENHNLIPVCPEIYGGLQTPREPAEIKDGKVINRKGEDVSENFIKGAYETLNLAKLYNCKYAILKERSPSCGFGQIYDGTFSGNLVKGNGIAAELLSKNGIEIIGESELGIGAIFLKTKEVKIEIYIPSEFIVKLRDELNKVNAGKIGNYDNCISVVKVKGYWRPLEEASPYLGNIGEVSEGEECKVEVRCRMEYVKDAIKVIKKVHPYEEPVFNIIPILNDLFE